MNKSLAIALSASCIALLASLGCERTNTTRPANASGYQANSGYQGPRPALPPQRCLSCLDFGFPTVGYGPSIQSTRSLLFPS